MALAMSGILSVWDMGDETQNSTHKYVFISMSLVKPKKGADGDISV